MASLSEMLGIMQTGGTALRQGFSEGMDRKRQSMLDANELERQKRLDEQNKKESDARLGLVDLQTKSAKRDLDTAMQGDTESSQMALSAKEMLQRDIEEFSKIVQTPEDEQILKQAKDNLRMANAISKWDPDKAGKFFVSPFDMKSQLEGQKQKSAMESEKFGLEKGKTQAEIEATRALTKERMAGATKDYADAEKSKKEISLMGSDQVGKDGFRLGKTTKEGLYQAGSTFVPGLKPKADVAITKKAVDDIKQAAGFYDNLKFGIKELTNLYKEHGTEAVGETSDRMRSIVRDMQLNAKELYNLGVLNGPDLQLMEQMVPDPSSTSANLKSKLTLGVWDPYTPKMQEFEKAMDTRFAQKADRFGFDMDSEPQTITGYNGKKGGQQTDRRAAAKQAAGYGGSKPANPFDLLNTRGTSGRF